MKIISLYLLSTLLIFSVGCKKNGQQEETTTTPNPPSVEVDTSFEKEITFPSLDSLLITADHYHLGMDKPVVVLCHQAGYSRGEYKEIADSLNRLGFNCIAIDQRSGNAVNGINNETHTRAVSMGKPTGYNDAKQDIVASIKWAKSFYNKKVILWGSSYSSSLSLIVAKENSEVEKVLAFSPGEYLSPVNVKSTINGLNKPSFLTSSKSEEAQTKELFDVITSANKIQFVPLGNGRHGSSALWNSQVDHPEYWVAVKTFLGV